MFGQDTNGSATNLHRTKRRLAVTPPLRPKTETHACVSISKKEDNISWHAQKAPFTTSQRLTSNPNQRLIARGCKCILSGPLPTLKASQGAMLLGTECLA
jgi:hypothetical protein